MTLDFMSSEESANGSDIDDDKFIEKPIPWRSEKLTHFFKNKLDPATFSKKGKHMRQHRIEGLQQSGKLLFESIKIVCGCCTVQSTLSLSSRLSECELN